MLSASKRLEVRQRYDYRCGYCGVSEEDTGGELTIDHFNPRKSGIDNSDDNLVYCCVRCNLYKAAIHPALESIGPRRLLHPQLDKIAKHLQEDPETGIIHPLTETGEFHLAVLHLNRSGLIQHRLASHLKQYIMERNRLLEMANESLEETVASQRRVIRRLKSLKRRKTGND